ncbi:ornithine cyclodeaminase/alanine dehydrogenase-like protein (mu-crystallin family) [Bradyrhizobium sp. GM7.3]
MEANRSIITTAIPLYLNSATVQQCLTDDEIYDVVSRTLRESSNPELIRGGKSDFGVDIDGDHLHMGNVSACVLSGSVAGTKWFVVSPSNASRNLERVQASILICDAATGVPLRRQVADLSADRCYGSCGRSGLWQESMVLVPSVERWSNS